jgi:subtilase-type serine protease
MRRSGGTAAWRHAYGDTTSSLQPASTVGLRASTPLSFGSADVTLRGMAGWRHAYGDVRPLLHFAFTGMDTFEISALPIARDAALLEAGLDVGLTPAATFGLSYQGQIASEVQDHGFGADLTVRF